MRPTLDHAAPPRADGPAGRCVGHAGRRPWRPQPRLRAGQPARAQAGASALLAALLRAALLAALLRAALMGAALLRAALMGAALLRAALMGAALLLAALLLTACASGPAAPDWRVNARAASDQAMAAYLRGDSRAAQADFDRARHEIARTGRADLLARIELLVCAARVASLEFGPCDGFERLRPDTAAPERAYADYLAGRLQPGEAGQAGQAGQAGGISQAGQAGAIGQAGQIGQIDQIGQLPAAQQGVAMAADAGAAAAALQQITDPASRLVAAGVLLQTGRASPPVLTIAVETASAMGWRRPLLAWLGLQLQRAEAAGDAAAVDRLRRRIGWIESPTGAPR